MIRTSTEIVLIEWQDIHSPASGWVDTEEAVKYKPMPCKTVGFLVSETGSQIITAHNKSQDGEWHGLEVIPKGCVVRIRRMK